MNIRFLTLAQREVDDAVLWYDNQFESGGRGLGGDDLISTAASAR